MFSRCCCESCSEKMQIGACACVLRIELWNSGMGNSLGIPSSRVDHRIEVAILITVPRKTIL